MTRFIGVVTVVVVVFLAMAFAAGNAGNEVNLNLFFFTLYRVPVTLVAFAGLFSGMVIMFATGIHSDLKVRRILRERLAEESRQEKEWIDRDQRDLFTDQPEAALLVLPEARGSDEGGGGPVESEGPKKWEAREESEAGPLQPQENLETEEWEPGPGEAENLVTEEWEPEIPEEGGTMGADESESEPDPDGEDRFPKPYDGWSPPSSQE